MANAEGHVPGRSVARNSARRLMRPAVGLAAVIGFQLLLASVFLGVLHRPALHHAPVAVAGSSRLAGVLEQHGTGGTIRLVPEPSAAKAQAAIRDEHVYGAIVGGRAGDELLTASARSPGTASALTKELTLAAAQAGVRLQVRDLDPLPASDPAGSSAYYLIVGWMLGGDAGATMLGMMLGGVRSPGVRHAGLRLGLLAGYAAVSGFLGALLIGPAMGVVSGYSVALAGVGILVVLAAGAATAGLQGALGMPGTLIAVIGMVEFGNPTAGQSIATPLLASPWNVIGQGLPPGAGLSAARSVIYLGGTGLAQPLTVLSVYTLALVMLAAASWRQRRPAVRAAVAGAT